MKRAERPGLHRWSRHEYARLIDHGLLDEDDPIELLDGLLLVKDPQLNRSGLWQKINSAGLWFPANSSSISPTGVAPPAGVVGSADGKEVQAPPGVTRASR